MSRATFPILSHTDSDLSRHSGSTSCLPSNWRSIYPRRWQKKTSIHLVNTPGFAGIHPRKRFLYLNVRMNRPLQSERVAKSEQVSKHRYHNEIKIIAPDEVDDELIGWLKEAYRLA